MAKEQRRRTRDRAPRLDPDEYRRRLRGCVGKEGYPSKKNAAARARLVAATYPEERGWNAYRCARCHRWHIGHSRRL